MKVKVYAVLDSASGVYDGPHPTTNDQVAMRNFTNVVKDPKTVVAKNPEYFSLWRVGEWNDATGEIVPKTMRHYTSHLLRSFVKMGTSITIHIRSQKVHSMAQTFLSFRNNFTSSIIPFANTPKRKILLHVFLIFGTYLN